MQTFHANAPSAAPASRLGGESRTPPALLHRRQSLDELSLRFVISSHRAKRPLLDFGCGDGLATQAALALGAHVCAVDCDEQRSFACL